MVSLCGGCNLYEPWAALIVGSMGGVGFITVHFAMLRFKLDDPLDAVAVHGAGGLVGILSVPWFMYVGLEKEERGIFWDGHAYHPWVVLGHNIAGALCIVLWSAFWSALLFGSLKFFELLRVSTDAEFKGMDLIKHGESAYPAAVSLMRFAVLT
jgi:Amt family ammonium transporter